MITFSAMLSFRLSETDNKEMSALGYRIVLSRINKLLRHRTGFMRY